MARVTWRLLFSSRRWVTILVASGLPPLVAWVLKAEVGAADPAQLETFFGGLANSLVFTLLLPLIGLVHGTAAVRLELDDGTLRYVLAKPLGRGRIVVVKWIVATAAVILTVLPGVVLAGWILLDHPVHALVRAAGAGVVVGAGLYAALFLALGLVTRRALLLGLVYVLAWEGALANVFAGVRVLSVREYASAAVRRVAGEPLQLGSAPALEPVHALWLGLAALGTALAFSIVRLRGIEVVEEA